MADKPIELKPIKDSKDDYDKIEVVIKSKFRKMLYEPLMRELSIEAGPATENLVEAVARGRITFSQGRFSGRFSAALSRELRNVGATWDKKTRTFRMRQADLPPQVASAVSVSEARFRERLKRVDKLLSQNLPEEIAGAVQISHIFDSTLWKTDRQFRKTLLGITVPPQLTPERSAKIASEWQNNMQLWIKDFAADEIVRLRQQVQRAAFSGKRYEATAKTIQRSYGVTEDKAKFLARQETSLLMAKFKETRYLEVGVEEYRWGCVAGSGNHPVRPAHKALEGKIFKFREPPVTTEPGEPQRRNNPGEDFNCRCFSRPIVRFRRSDE